MEEFNEGDGEQDSKRVVGSHEQGNPGLSAGPTSRRAWGGRCCFTGQTPGLWGSSTFVRLRECPCPSLSVQAVIGEGQGGLRLDEEVGGQELLGLG